MSWTHRSMIVAASVVADARALAAMFPGGAGMWETPLAPTSAGPATHYISSGLIWPEFAAMLVSPQALVDGCASYGVTVEMATATALLDASDVSTEDGHTAMARLGLVMVRGAM